jgi:hypothetical protein
LFGDLRGGLLPGLQFFLRGKHVEAMRRRDTGLKRRWHGDGKKQKHCETA